MSILMDLFGIRPRIKFFDGELEFLSNTYRHRKPIQEIVGCVTLSYPTVAHAIRGVHQSEFTDKFTIMQIADVASLPPVIKANPGIVEGCLRQKFGCVELINKLKATGNAKLQGADALTCSILETLREEAFAKCSTIQNSNLCLGIEASITS